MVEMSVRSTVSSVAGERGGGPESGGGGGGPGPSAVSTSAAPLSVAACHSSSGAEAAFSGTPTVPSSASAR